MAEAYVHGNGDTVHVTHANLAKGPYNILVSTVTLSRYWSTLCSTLLGILLHSPHEHSTEVSSDASVIPHSSTFMNTQLSLINADWSGTQSTHERSLLKIQSDAWSTSLKLQDQKYVLHAPALLEGGWDATQTGIDMTDPRSGPIHIC